MFFSWYGELWTCATLGNQSNWHIPGAFFWFLFAISYENEQEKIIFFKSYLGIVWCLRLPMVSWNSYSVHLRTSNPQRATRPRLQVPPTAMLYVPSPIRLRNAGCLILEQTTGWDSQRILGEMSQGTPGCPLADSVPQSTHLTHTLSQPIPSAHIDPRKKLPPK